MFLPAMNFTSSPAFTCSVVVPVATPPSVAPDVVFQLALLIALATVVPFTKLSPSVTDVVPFGLVVKSVVLTGVCLTSTL